MADAHSPRDEVDVEHVPGTVHLVDLEGTMRGAHASGAGQRDVVLVPSPSADPDDPLNWAPRRKWTSTAANGVYNLTIGIASAAVYSVLEPISRDTGLTVAQLNAGTGYMFLMFVSGQRTERGHRLGRRGSSVPMLTIVCQLGVGLSVLAGCGVAVWKETSVSILPTGNYGDHDLGASCNVKWCLDRSVLTCDLTPTNDPPPTGAIALKRRSFCGTLPGLMMLST